MKIDGRWHFITIYQHECEFFGKILETCAAKQTYCCHDCYIKDRFWRKEDTAEIVKCLQERSEYYNLDVIISVGYHVKSKRGTQFRIWAMGQTKVLYEKALEYAQLHGEEIVWDLYCGIGTISLFLARKAKQVYGVDIQSKMEHIKMVGAFLMLIFKKEQEFFRGTSGNPRLFNCRDERVK